MRPFPLMFGHKHTMNTEKITKIKNVKQKQLNVLKKK